MTSSRGGANGLSPKRARLAPIESPAPPPTRTCVGCRGQDSRANLVRLVLDESGTRVVLDESKTLPGRGAWIHSGTCLQLALRRRSLPRALRAAGPLDLGAVLARFAITAP